MATYKYIQDTNTFIKTVSDQNCALSHPWTKDKRLLKLRQFRRRAKQIYEESPNELKKAFLKLVNVQLTKRYRHLKLQYYDKIIRDSNGDRRQLYTMLSKKKKQNVMPHTMTIHGLKIAEKN